MSTSNLRRLSSKFRIHFIQKRKEDHLNKTRTSVKTRTIQQISTRRKTNRKVLYQRELLKCRVKKSRTVCTMPTTSRKELNLTKTKTLILHKETLLRVKQSTTKTLKSTLMMMRRYLCLKCRKIRALETTKFLKFTMRWDSKQSQ